MARPLRVAARDLIYLVLNRANGRHAIFEEARDDDVVEEIKRSCQVFHLQYSPTGESRPPRGNDLYSVALRRTVPPVQRPKGHKQLVQRILFLETSQD